MITIQHRHDPWRLNLHRAAFGMLWLFVFCFPWEETLIVPVHLPASHIAGALAAFLGVTSCLKRGRIRRPQAMHWIAAALVIWAGLSYGWSIDRELTMVRASSYFQLFFMVWLIWEFAGSLDRQLSLFAAYVLGTWVSAGSTLYSFITETGTNLALNDGRYTAAGTNENELGIVLALGIGMASHLLTSKPRYQALWLASVPVFATAILLTGSRGSFLSSLIAFALFPLSLGGFKLKAQIAGGIALVVLLAAGAAMLPSTTWQRLESIPAELSHGTLTKRTYIWRAGLDAYRKHPLIGVGAGAFQASVYKQLGIAYVAHNTYLSVLVELGAIGMILFTGLLIALLRAAMLLPRQSKRAWIVLLLTWGVAVSSVTWEHRKPTWFLFSLLIARSATLGRRSIREKAAYAGASLNGSLPSSLLEHAGALE
jgi:O-antigen ligase